MQPFGTVLLSVAFFSTLASGLAAIYGAVSRNATLVRGARYGIYATAFLYLAMAGILWHGYFSHDFANKYIASYSDTEMPLVYLFTSFWGGEKGALLFWCTMLTVFSAIAMHQARDKDVAYLGWAGGILMGAVFFYDILMVFESNPFEVFLTHHGPRDGEGLNPLLQNPTMAIHPPSLLTGYIAFTLPFAFGAASLITGRLDDQWAKDTRKWTLVSWVFLTTGLVLGGAWAYEELGWGGFWMWDPVENAGLIPWFTATAFLHSIVIQERRGLLRRWNFTLVCLTFFLTIFGTFLTRSQLIVSIHAFADSKVSNYFLYYMAFIGIVSVCLLGWRWPKLRSAERIESFMSREAFFVLNNIMLCMCAFIIIWGTLYSKSAEFANLFAAMGTNFLVDVGHLTEGQDLGEPWFNKVMVPAGVILLGLTAVGPLIAWRRTTWKSFNRTFIVPLALACVPMLLGSVALIYYRCKTFGDIAHGSLIDGYNLWVLTVEPSDIFAFFGIFFALFVFTGVGTEFWKGGRIRQRSRGGSLGGNVWQLTLKAKRRYGGYIVHVGVAIACLGFAGVAFKKEAPETPLHLGDSLKLGQYNLTYVNMEDEYRHGEGFVATTARIVVMEHLEAVPTTEVDRVTAYLQEREYEPFHVETRPHNPKIFVRFASIEHRDRVREEMYLTDVMKSRFEQLPRSSSDKKLSLRFTFKDMELIQTFPPIIHKQVDDVRRTLGSLAVGRAKVVATPGRPIFTVTWENPEDFNRAVALLRAEEPAVADVLMCRLNPAEGAMEIVTANTGRVMIPEVRRYKKHSNPTTEVAIWSRIHEDVYLAMRPDLSQPFINLVAYINPMINLLWLGTVVMFLGGLFLIFPTNLFVARARRAATSSAGILLAAALGVAALLTPQSAAASDDADEVLSIMKCACEEGGDRVFHEQDTLLECKCPLGVSMRRRVEDYISSASPAELASKQAQMDFFETLFDEDPSNERYVIFPSGDHGYLMKNTMCSCGCGKMALSQCPLDCPWSPVYKRRFKVLLALGFTRDEAREYYLEDANKTHRREKSKFTLADISLNTEETSSWAVPVAGGAVAAFLIIAVLMYRARLVGAEHNRKVAAAIDAKPAGELSALDREMLDDELDDIGG